MYKRNSLTVLISSFNSTLNYQNKHSVSHIRGGQYDQNIILQIKQFYNNNIIIFWCKQGCYDTNSDISEISQFYQFQYYSKILC